MKHTFVQALATRRKQSGFTLIELLVVVTLSIMLMLAASSLFFMFLISSTKAGAVQRVKNEGEHALDQMAFLLRNALELETNSLGQKCQEDMSEITFTSLDGGITTLSSETDSDGFDKIASNSGQYLTSGGVELLSGPEFDCVESSDGASQYVTITFILRKGTPGIDEPRDIVQETFSTGVNVRSF
jgi:prepilin-type N-terminal cleavage/methylation domain-containing protein